MAIFTAIATAVAATFTISSLVTFAVSTALSIGLSYAVKALSGQPEQKTDNFGVQGKLSGGGDVPRSFGLGYHVTAGSLVYANTWSNGYATPNAFLSQVIAVSDLPGEDLIGLWVNGEKVTLALDDALYSNFGSSSLGYQVPEYVRLNEGESSPTAHLYVKYYDGTQTVADGAMINASSIERPYTSAHVGKGMCYVVLHAMINEKVWNGFPTFKFEMSGLKLYDPSKDSTVGGSGSHVYSDPSTWGGDGDDFPAVQIYNILRGFSYNGTWLYGLQNMTAARLPVANWITQIAKCRTTVVESSGAQPTYRTGGQINVDAQPANAIEAILTGCQGRVSEIGGFYKIHVGAPDSPTFTFSDDDILSTEEQTYRPFFSLADSVNGIQATYPDPEQGWNSATAPPYYRTDLEARDGGRRLMANPAFDFVPYPEQVQRLQKSAIEEAQRARGHTLTFPPAFWIVESGDVGEWTSVRNGYSAKQFRVDSIADKANLDVSMSLTEVNPDDYDWDTGTDFTPVTGGGTLSPPPTPQGVASWDAQEYTLLDSTGLVRRPAILISWDGTQPGCNGLKYEVRLASDGSSVTRGTVNSFNAGNRIITESILPNTTYEVRGQYIATTPRDMLWTDYVTVTTEDIRYSLAEFDAAVRAQVTEVQDYLQDQINEAVNRISSIASDIAARAPLDQRQVRSQLAARYGDALAQIDEVRTVAVTTEAAYASFSTTATATWGSTTAFVENSAAAIATLDGYAAAQYGVTLNVNGYATGFNLVNGGSGTSSFTVVADKFQIQQPGYNGSAPVPVFTVGTIGGVSAVGISGNLVLDGTLFGSRIVAGSINTTQLAVNSVDINQLIDGAASNSDAATGTFGALGSGTLASKTVTTKNGRAIIIGMVSGTANTGASSTVTVTLKVDGSTVATAIGQSAVETVDLLGGAHTYTRIPPVPVATLVTGLSDGSHTFELTCSLGNVTGTLIVLNPRR